MEAAWCWDRLLTPVGALLLRQFFDLLLRFFECEETRARLAELEVLISRPTPVSAREFKLYTRDACIRRNKLDFDGGNIFYATTCVCVLFYLRRRQDPRQERINQLWSSTREDAEETEAALSRKGDLIEFLLNMHRVTGPAVSESVRERRVLGGQVSRDLYDAYVCLIRCVWLGAQRPCCREFKPTIVQTAMLAYAHRVHLGNFPRATYVQLCMVHRRPGAH